MITKPMLADKAKDVSKLEYPLLATPKIDGIRCLKVDGKALTRSFKPIPNEYIRTTLERLLPEGADGEIFSGATFQGCTSAVMSQAGTPPFRFCMFDYVKDSLGKPYRQRLRDMLDWHRSAPTEAQAIVWVLPFVTLHTPAELLRYEVEVLKDGDEGVMVRAPDGPYKCGRATNREGYLLKVVRFETTEAEVIGFEEQQHNENELQRDAFGNAKRSSAKAGKRPAGTLGKFKVRQLEDYITILGAVIKAGTEFTIGTGEGLTADLRQQIWDDASSHLGKVVKYKFKPHGVLEKPRMPIWLGFRDARDM